MTNEFARSPLAKAGLRLAAITVLIGGLAACSTMESLDPTGLLGGDSTGGTSDTGGLSQTDAPSSGAPDVADIPDRPKPVAGAEDNAKVTSSLQEDAANIQYSAESLRGGTEAAANGPQPPSAPAEAAAVTAPTAAAQPAEASPSSAAYEPANQPRTAEQYAEAPAQPAAAAPPPDAPEISTIADVPAQPEPAASPGAPTQVAAAPLTEAPPQPAPAPPPPEPSATDVAAVVPEAAPAPDPVSEAPTPPAETALAEAPSQPAAAPSPDIAPAAAPAPQPAPPPVQVADAGPVPGAQAPVTRRAAPGFAPSNAPPLDPTVSRFVAAPVVARYRQTAALQPSVYPDSTPTPGYYGPATATVHFPDNTTILDDRGRQQVRAAAELFKSHGSRGFVRVVGYASSASGNLSPNRLIQVNFEQSRARATTIARALMKEGVPANKVLVDSAAQTSANAKAEIFVQG